MDIILTSPDIPADNSKNGLWLLLAAVVHALVIFGLDFEFKLDQTRTPPALEVVLVEPTKSEAPEEADYLAQASQDGGGESAEHSRPSTPFASQQDFQTDGIAPQPMEAAAPEPVNATSESVVTTIFSEDLVSREDRREVETTPLPKQSEILIEQDLAIAKLSAEVNAQVEEHAKRPKKKVINARTKEAASAKYMASWVEKVERIGNLNYPDQARRRQLSGALMLIVGIYKNGQIESITVDESSGFKLLDDAAVRIVRMAAPFDALTGQLAEETDILYIVRTWDFNSNAGNNRLTSY